MARTKGRRAAKLKLAPVVPLRPEPVSAAMQLVNDVESAVRKFGGRITGSIVILRLEDHGPCARTTRVVSWENPLELIGVLETVKLAVYEDEFVEEVAG